MNRGSAAKLTWFDWKAGVLALCFAIAGSLPFLTTIQQQRNSYYFEVTLTSDTSGFAQIFWDTGVPISESESSIIPLYAGGSKRVYRFGLPPKNIKSIRFDLIDRPGRLTVSNARIVTSYGSVVCRIPLEEFSPGPQIADFRKAGGSLAVMTTADANDPNLLISPKAKIELARKPWGIIRAVGGVFLTVFIFGILVGSPRVVSFAGGKLAPIFQWTHRHPRLAITAVALLATAIQAHPVLFFGKSYASPNNGTYMLYGSMPTLPGATDTQFEATLGSDVGALLFNHLYYPIVEHRALAAGEWPLWNRYCMTGVPLLGQGQSMLGDPFNLIAIATNSALWAWDTKFLIAHFIFSAALGLTVWNLTRNGGASALVAAASGFIGMFTFDLNHPRTFTLCYSALIIWAFSGLKAKLGSRRALALWLIAWFAGNWLVLNSGTVKEAYLTMACLNFSGAAMIIFGDDEQKENLRKLIAVIVAGVVLIAVSAPLWWSFLSTLSRSMTDYDVPRADVFRWHDFIGIFDELFFRQHSSEENAVGPALNFVFFLGCLGWMASPAGWRKNKSALPLMVTGLLPFCLAFGLLPLGVVLKIPLLSQVVHLGPTFACPLLIILAVIAGFGFAEVSKTFSHPKGFRSFLCGVAMAAVLGVIYFDQSFPDGPSRFFRGYAASIALAATALASGTFLYARYRQPSLLLMCLVLGFPLLTWRHAQYLHTPFDHYVFNPHDRVSLTNVSSALKSIEQDVVVPVRVVGLNNNLFPAYQTVPGLESLYGADALKNRFYFDFASAAILTRVFLWDRGLTEAQLDKEQPIYDFLNVQDFLGSVKFPPAQTGAQLKLLTTEDLRIYRSATTWPRAFFTQRVIEYSKATDLVNLIRRFPTRHFAAVQRNQLLPGPVKALALRQPRVDSVAAQSFLLTPNSTKFSIDAPAEGVVALQEAFYPESFNVKLNGAPVSYFRVNHAFKGIYIPAAGHYEVSFAYWPEHFGLTLIVSALGILFGATWLGWAWLAGESSRKTSAGMPSSL